MMFQSFAALCMKRQRTLWQFWSKKNWPFRILYTMICSNWLLINNKKIVFSFYNFVRKGIYCISQIAPNLSVDVSVLSQNQTFHSFFLSRAAQSSINHLLSAFHDPKNWSLETLKVARLLYWLQRHPKALSNLRPIHNSFSPRLFFSAMSKLFSSSGYLH